MNSKFANNEIVIVSIEKVSDPKAKIIKIGCVTGNEISGWEFDTRDEARRVGITIVNSLFFPDSASKTLRNTQRICGYTIDELREIVEQKKM